MTHIDPSVRTGSGPSSGYGGDGGGNVVAITDLHVEFPTALGVVQALNGVSIDIARGRVLGVVGESGCGKSVTARAMLQIIEPPGRIVKGEILLWPGSDNGRTDPNPTATDADLATETAASVNGAIDLARLDPRGQRMRDIRGDEIAMIFQEPMTSLNPVYTVGSQIAEAILLHQTSDKREAWARSVEMLRRVGMPNPDRVAASYPHQLSGGMRQRAMIAMALSCAPNLLIADEPTTALDVTTEAQILNLMRELQHDVGMSIMFITHSMGVVAQMCDEVVVMYLGQIMERASVEDLFYDPKHPYTISLLRSIPRIGYSRHEPLEVIQGAVPDPYTTVPGCPFHPRCPSAMTGLCDRVEPLEAPLEGSQTHTVKCHLYPGSTPEDIAVQSSVPTTPGAGEPPGSAAPSGDGAAGGTDQAAEEPSAGTDASVGQEADRG